MCMHACCVCACVCMCVRVRVCVCVLYMLSERVFMNVHDSLYVPSPFLLSASPSSVACLGVSPSASAPHWRGQGTGRTEGTPPASADQGAHLLSSQPSAQVKAKRELNAGHVQVTCRSHVGHMQVTCRSHAG